MILNWLPLNADADFFEKFSPYIMWIALHIQLSSPFLENSPQNVFIDCSVEFKFNFEEASIFKRILELSSL